MRHVIESTTECEDRDELGALLVLCGQGDQVAFAALYDEAASRAYGLSVRVLRDGALAEEATQEAFIDVWRCASRFDPRRGTGRAWLFTIVHRQAVARVRSVSAATKRDQKYVDRTHRVDHDATSEVALQHIDAQRVRLALLRLTPLERQAIELSYFDALTYTEVAATLEIPLGTAKSRIRSGLIRLRAEWAQAS